MDENQTHTGRRGRRPLQNTFLLTQSVGVDASATR